MSAPHKMYKKIDGRSYRYATYKDTKAQAVREAKQYREHYTSVRVTKEKSPLGKTYYAIWIFLYRNK